MDCAKPTEAAAGGGGGAGDDGDAAGAAGDGGDSAAAAAATSHPAYVRAQGTSANASAGATGGAYMLRLPKADAAAALLREVLRFRALAGPKVED